MWLQGMNTKGRENAPEWEKTLYLRLERLYAALGTGVGTKATEQELKWERHAYFSINCPFPEYELRVIVFKPGAVLDAATRTAPFDTGGMRDGKIELSVGASAAPADREALIEYYSSDLTSTRTTFPPWVNENYSTVGLYEFGTRPEHAAFAPEVAITGANDARAWSWEARVPFSSDLRDGLEPRRIYMSPDDWADYEKWVLDEYPQNGLRHLEWLRKLQPPDLDPIGSMGDDLRKGVFL